MKPEAPARDGAPGNAYDFSDLPSGTTSGTPSETAEALRRIVTSLPSHRMGGSRVRELGEVADAYEEARNALAQASRLPDRVALGEDRMHLVDVLPPKTARRWAGTLLHPLLTLPMSRRDQLLRCYPQMPEFLRRKRLADPDERFSSDWYRHLLHCCRICSDGDRLNWRRVGFSACRD